MLRRHAVLTFALFLIFSAAIHAEDVLSPEHPFSVTPSAEWIELELPLQGVLVSYGKKGTLATFHISERDLEEPKTLDELRWEELFSPQFSEIHIRLKGETVLGGEKAKYCIYTLKPGEYQKTMEGKLPGKYINYVLIHDGKLFSITFKDTADGFALDYPAFLAAMRTIRLGAPGSQSSGGER